MVYYLHTYDVFTYLCMLIYLRICIFLQRKDQVLKFDIMGVLYSAYLSEDFFYNCTGFWIILEKCASLEPEEPKFHFWKPFRKRVSLMQMNFVLAFPKWT